MHEGWDERGAIDKYCRRSIAWSTIVVLCPPSTMSAATIAKATLFEIRGRRGRRRPGGLQILVGDQCDVLRAESLRTLALPSQRH